MLSSLFLKLGGEEVEYDPGFQLYLQTKLSNPHYKPEIAAQVNTAPNVFQGFYTVTLALLNTER